MNCFRVQSYAVLGAQLRLLQSALGSSPAYDLPLFHALFIGVELKRRKSESLSSRAWV